uniref:Uncharacterized protein n=1 Tax=Anguilla anguilla TaxID=7936 RepID=A0A0E9PHP9_ANGAN
MYIQKYVCHFALCGLLTRIRINSN